MTEYRSPNPLRSALLVLLPYLLGLLCFLVVIPLLVATDASEYHLMISGLVMMAACITVYLIVLYIYGRDVFSNPRVDASTRFAWLIGFLFIGLPIFGLYWYKQIYKQEDDKVESDYSN